MQGSWTFGHLRCCGCHRPTWAPRIGLGPDPSCKRRSRAEPRPRGPRFRMSAPEYRFRSFAPEPQPRPPALVQAVALPEKILSSSFGSFCIRGLTGIARSLDIRRHQGNFHFWRKTESAPLLIVLMDVSACAQRDLQRFASLPRTTTSNRQLLSRSRADLRQTQRHTPKPMLRRWQGMFRQRQTLRRVQFLARLGRLECRLGMHAKELEEYRSLNKTQRAQRASLQS